MRKLILLALLASPAWCSVSYVKGCSSSAGATSVTCAFGSNVTSGNLLVVTSKTQVSGAGVTATVSITSFAGVACTWNAVKSPIDNDNGQWNLTEYYCVLPSTGAETVKATWTGAASSGSFTDIAVGEYNSTTGWQSPALDLAASVVNTNGGATSCATGSISTTNANDLLVATCQNWNSSETWGAVSGWTSRTALETASLGWYEKWVTSTGSQSVTIPLSSTDANTSIIAAFMTASGGGGGPAPSPRLTLMGVGL